MRDAHRFGPGALVVFGRSRHAGPSAVLHGLRRARRLSVAREGNEQPWRVAVLTRLQRGEPHTQDELTCLAVRKPAYSYRSAIGESVLGGFLQVWDKLGQSDIAQVVRRLAGWHA